MIPKGAACGGNIDICSTCSDRILHIQFPQEIQRLCRALHGRFFLPGLAVMAHQLIPQHELPLQVTAELRLLQPVEKMPLRAIVIPAAHVFIHLVNDPPLRDRTDHICGQITIHRAASLCGLSFVIMFWNNALKRFFIPVRIVYTEIRCDTSQKVEVRDGKKEISVF